MEDDTVPTEGGDALALEDNIHSQSRSSIFVLSAQPSHVPVF